MNQLDRLLEVYRAQGEELLLCHAIPWRFDHWTKWFADPDVAGFQVLLEAIRDLSQEIGGRLAISRQALFDLAATARSEPGEIPKLFLATMIWGFGTKGSGPAHALCMLRSYGSTKRLEAIFQRVNDPGSVTEAYDFLFRPSTRLCLLGESFGTKFLYFAGYDSQPPASRPLILDSVVRRRLKDLGHPLVGSGRQRYQRYIQWAESEARRMNLPRPDLVEFAVFRG